MVDVNYFIQIEPRGGMKQYPDMNIEFYLDFPQFVNIEYSIIVELGKDAHLITRVVVDGYEQPAYRCMTSNMRWYHSNQRSKKLWLGKGKHTAYV